MFSKEALDWSQNDWARKLKEQAKASEAYRRKLYDMVDLGARKRVLDVGCGSGAITYDMAQLTDAEIVALDVDPEMVSTARRLLADLPHVSVMEGDAAKLPFEDESFDLVVFTLVLIHIKDQEKGMREMARVTKKGGVVLATLEPDYEGMFGHPEGPFIELWKKTVKGLGADLTTGRRLKALFNQAGLRTEVGMNTEGELLFLNDDEKRLRNFKEGFWATEKILKADGWTDQQVEGYKEEQIGLIEKGISFMFQPMFYAIGRKD
jgi:ubiquinone/menaquinone biosynthesis C-methylase UbiE